MTSVGVACIVALGTAIGVAIALPEPERVDMFAAAIITVFFNALFSGWGFALGKTIVQMLRDSATNRS